MRDIVDEIGTGHDAVQKIIKELGYSKVCARWVPRMLTDELRQSRREGRCVYRCCSDTGWRERTS